jgi:hypothetical protein
MLNRFAALAATVEFQPVPVTRNGRMGGPSGRTESTFTFAQIVSRHKEIKIKSTELRRQDRLDSGKRALKKTTLPAASVVGTGFMVHALRFLAFPTSTRRPWFKSPSPTCSISRMTPTPGHHPNNAADSLRSTMAVWYSGETSKWPFRVATRQR